MARITDLYSLKYPPELIVEPDIRPEYDRHFLTIKSIEEAVVILIFNELRGSAFCDDIRQGVLIEPSVTGAESTSLPILFNKQVVVAEESSFHLDSFSICFTGTHKKKSIRLR